MLYKYIIYQDKKNIAGICDDYSSALIMENDLKKKGKCPQIYILAIADGEWLQNGKK